MKVIDFNNYSDSQIKEVSLKLRQLNPEDDKTLPSEIYDYLNKENPQVGNIQTRTLRCISLLNNQIISRFLK